MFTRLIRRLHRDRRRIAVAFLLLFAAGVVETWAKTDLLPPGVLEVIAGVGMVALFGTFLIAVGLGMPVFRHAYAPIGLTLFGAAVLGRVFPGSAFSLMTITEGGIRSVGGLITTGLIVHFMFYGRWSDKLFKARRSRITTRLTTALEADQVWHGMVPTPGRREDLHDSDIVSVDWVDRERTRIRIIRWVPPAAKVEEYLQIEDLLHGAYVVYRYVRPGAKPEQLEKGLRAIKVIDMVDKRVVYVTEFSQGRALREVLFDWLDDGLGRIEDERLQRLESAIASARVKGQVRRDHLAIGGPLRPQPKPEPAAEVTQLDPRRKPRLTRKPRSRPSSQILAAGE